VGLDRGAELVGEDDPEAIPDVERLGLAAGTVVTSVRPDIMNHMIRWAIAALLAVIALSAQQLPNVKTERAAPALNSGRICATILGGCLRPSAG
jgi:hypothetical protein